MIHFKSADLKKEKIESLVIPVCEDKDIHEDETILSLIRSAKKSNNLLHVPQAFRDDPYTMTNSLRSQ